jgi:hypothetical protein
MKYLLLMQFPLQDWRTKRMDLWPTPAVKAHMEYLRGFRKELTEAGELVSVEGLVGPEEAREVRAGKEARPEVTDGPFAESKEFLAGYVVVDVDSPRRAYEIAALWSAGPGPDGKPGNLPVQVRQIMSGALKSSE